MEQADWVRIFNAHEAIIDMETWTRTQERLGSHARVGKRSQELSPFAGKVGSGVFADCPIPKDVVYEGQIITARMFKNCPDLIYVTTTRANSLRTLF